MKIENLVRANEIQSSLVRLKRCLNLWENAYRFYDTTISISYARKEQSSANGDVHTQDIDFEIVKQLTIVKITRNIKELEEEFAKID